MAGGDPAAGYLGVVPEHRGRGYADDLLGECTRFLAVEQDAERIVANTDVGNVPMAAAFARAALFDRLPDLNPVAPPRWLGSVPVRQIAELTVDWN